MVMAETPREIEGFLAQVMFPASKEALINALLVAEAPRRAMALAERLPRDRYTSWDQLRQDLDEVSRLQIAEVRAAHGYDDYQAIVTRHVGDIRHATKEAYNRVAAQVVEVARQEGRLGSADAGQMLDRLRSAFADMRGSMSEVYDEDAPVDPLEGLPRVLGPS
jgi:hypothetical protein